MSNADEVYEEAVGEQAIREEENHEEEIKEGKVKTSVKLKTEKKKIMAQNTITCGQFRYEGDSVTLGRRRETWLDRF